ncbi:hypothetical protein [Nocardia seriolae]|uniref:DUF8020 domain-containing protein n=1 Tax=Nocardia seriolae TaxID=37332 RepID=A0A0B8NFC6_9NOCA|nr:hypothetical protein [Nocardia seriolae]MTJ61753.1 hypothetical protein [Nocardia seriolae]MTJ76103.1 hypothetical protein [Nocardia seriolae]MTJ86758.1 hypothetical protein [Nocardia seriolae]MTK30753.1 hypothetical protein [Nocardia seriolae]MTK39724.1 hypothetical protein [Nocardia seriolae]
MRIRMLACLATLTSAALLTTHANANAEPPAADSSMSAQARIVDRSVELRTDAGSLRVDHNHLQILDPHGVVVGALPLLMAKAGTAYPIDARIDGTTATLTPRGDEARPLTADEQRTAAQAASAPVRNFDLRPIADADSPEDRFNTAMGNVNNELTVALAVGTLLGAIVGGPLGYVFTGALGTAAGGPLGTIVGCLAGAVVGAGMGVVAFNLIIGVPALIGSAVHYFNVVNAPPAVDAAPVND